MRPALNKQYSSHENLIGGGGGGETIVDGRRPSVGNAITGQQSKVFQRQGSRDSINSIDQHQSAHRLFLRALYYDYSRLVGTVINSSFEIRIAPGQRKYFWIIWIIAQLYIV